MTSGQKVASSLLISVLCFSLFTVFAFSGLFDLVEVNYYQPLAKQIKEQKLQEIAEAQNEYLEILATRFDNFAKNKDVKTYANLRPGDSSVQNRERLRAELITNTQALTGIRIVDSNGRNLYFSTFEDDKIKNSKTKAITYKNYNALNEYPFEAVKSVQEIPENSSAITKTRLVRDSKNNQLVFSLPFYDEKSVQKGTILFYCDAGHANRYLFSRNLIDMSGFGVLVAEEPSVSSASQGGFVFGLPNYGQKSLEEQILSKWKNEPNENFWKIISENEGEFAEKSEGEASEKVQNGLENLLSIFKDEPQSSASLCVFSYKNEESLFGNVAMIYGEEEIKFPPYLRILLLGATFITFYLVIFLLFSFKHDDLVVIRARVASFQKQFLKQYKKRADVEDDKELPNHKKYLEERIKKSLGRLAVKYSKETETLIEKSWNKILIELGKTSAVRDEESIVVNKNELREMLEDILGSGKLRVQAVQAVEVQQIEQKTQVEEHNEEIPETDNKVEETAEEIPATVDEVSEADEIEEMEEVSDAEEIEEIEEVPEADEVEEMEEVSEAEEVEEMEEVSEAEEIEEMEEVSDAEEIEEIEEVPEADEVEEMEEISEADEIEEMEEVSDAEEIEEIEEVPEADEVEEMEEVSEAEAVEEMEEIPEADEAEEMEEVSDAEEIEEIEEVSYAEEVEEMEEVSEAEAVEEMEEIPEADEAEEMEEVPEADEVEEMEEVSDAEAVEEIEEIPEADEVEEMEEVSEADEVEEIEEVPEADEVEEMEEVPEADEVEKMEEVSEGDALETETVELDEYISDEPESESADDDILREELVFSVPESEIAGNEDDGGFDDFQTGGLDYGFLDETDSDETLFADDSDSVTEEVESPSLTVENNPETEEKVEEIQDPDVMGETVEQKSVQPQKFDIDNFEIADPMKAISEYVEEIDEELPEETNENLPEESSENEISALEELEVEETMPFTFTQLAANNASLEELTSDIPDAIVQNTDGTFSITNTDFTASGSGIDPEFKKLVDSVLR